MVIPSGNEDKYISRYSFFQLTTKSVELIELVDYTFQQDNDHKYTISL